MIVTIVPDPLNQPDWPAIEAMLAPAARGAILDQNEVVWAVYDGPLIGAATARLTSEGFGEVVLIGGTGFRRWIVELEEMVSRWMRDEGMAAMRAYGRKGWARIGRHWNIIESKRDAVSYEKEL